MKKVIRAVLDRIEGSKAVFSADDRSELIFDLSAIPEAKEGNVYDLTLNGELLSDAVYLPDETDARSSRSSSRLRSLFKNKK